MPMQHLDIAAVSKNLEKKFKMEFHLNRIPIDSHAMGQGLDEIRLLVIKSKTTVYKS